MKIKNILVTLVILILSIQFSSANVVEEISIKYAAVLDKYEAAQSPDALQSFISRIDSKIDERLQNPQLSDLKKSLYLALKEVNAGRKDKPQEKDLVVNALKNTFYSETKDQTSNSEQSKAELFRTQAALENTMRWELEKSLTQQRDNDVLNAFSDAGYVAYSTNSQFEFVEENDIKKIDFTKYVRVTEGNYKWLLLRNKISKIGAEIIYDGQSYYIPTSGISIETKNAYSRSQTLFYDSLSHEENYTKKWAVYYTYDYDSYLFFRDDYGFYNKDLVNSDIIASNSLLLAEWWWIKIVRDFTEKRLIKDSFLDEVSDKEWFLSVLVKDAGYTQVANNDTSFERLKAITDALTDGKTRDEKIEAIYNFVLDNHYYYENFWDGNEDIFSGIDTFRNGYWVCDGYSKLMYYMLNFAGIQDIEHIRWYVYDAVDFPEIGHAWVRISNRYYDPTFDDPIGWVATLRKNEYRYFDLPKDLAYTNRFDGFDASEELKSMSLSERERLVEKNLFSLLWKYEKWAYNILWSFQVKEDLWFIAGELITLSKLQKKLRYYEVASDNSYIDENGTKRYIRSIEYYVTTDENINGIIDTLWEKFLNAVLLKWPLDTGSHEYRLAYTFAAR
jgi:transglutaminase-like putative cysteine protease